MKKITFIALLFIVMTTVYGVNVEDIISKADEAFKLKNLYSEIEITIVKNGKEQPKQVVKGYSTYKNGINYSLSVYQSPKKMKGNGNLMIGDDLWVKFASTGRVRKLSSSAKKNSSGGSDFSYADMGSSGEGMASGYNSTLISEESISGEVCYKIELTPNNSKDVNYDKLIIYIGKDSLRYLQIEYFEDNANTKTLELTNYRKVQDIYYPFLLIMQNHSKDSSTKMVTTEIEYNSNLVKDSMFSQSYLKKVK